MNVSCYQMKKVISKNSLLAMSAQKVEIVVEEDARLMLSNKLAVGKGYWILLMMLPGGFMIIPLWYWITVAAELSWYWFILPLNIAVQFVSVSLSFVICYSGVSIS